MSNHPGPDEILAHLHARRPRELTEGTELPLLPAKGTPAGDDSSDLQTDSDDGASIASGSDSTGSNWYSAFDEPIGSADDVLRETGFSDGYSPPIGVIITALPASPGAARRPLNVKNASSLELRMLKLAKWHELFNKLLDVMEENLVIVTPGGIERACMLLPAYATVFQRFRVLFPAGYRIDCTIDGAGDTNMTIITPSEKRKVKYFAPRQHRPCRADVSCTYLNPRSPPHHPILRTPIPLARYQPLNLPYDALMIRGNLIDMGVRKKHIRGLRGVDNLLTAATQKAWRDDSFDQCMAWGFMAGNIPLDWVAFSISTTTVQYIPVADAAGCFVITIDAPEYDALMGMQDCAFMGAVALTSLSPASPRVRAALNAPRSSEKEAATKRARNMGGLGPRDPSTRPPSIASAEFRSSEKEPATRRKRGRMRAKIEGL